MQTNTLAIVERRVQYVGGNGKTATFTYVHYFAFRIISWDFIITYALAPIPHGRSSEWEHCAFYIVFSKKYLGVCGSLVCSCRSALI